MNLDGFTQLIGDNQFLFFVLVAWSLVWKGLALWRAGRLGERGWFVALLILNTLGILELIYLFFITPRRQKRPPELT